MYFYALVGKTKKIYELSVQNFYESLTHYTVCQQNALEYAFTQRR